MREDVYNICSGVFFFNLIDIQMYEYDAATNANSSDIISRTRAGLHICTVLAV